MQTTLFKKILSVITIVLILSLTAAISINIYMTKNNYDKNIHEEMLFLSTYYHKELKTYIENQIKSLEHVVNSREFDVYSYTLQDKLIRELFGNYNNIFPKIYFIANDNSIVTYNESPQESSLVKSIELDLKKLQENPNKIVVSEIHYNEILQKPVITFSILKRNYFNEDNGIIFTVVPIDTFIKNSQIELKKDFIIRVIDKNGYIASSSKTDEIMKQLKIENDFKNNNELHSKLMGEDTCSYIVTTDYCNIIVSYPDKKFHELVSSLVQVNLLIYIFILLIAFIITYIFSKSLTNPLKSLLNQVTEYGQFKFDSKIEVKTNDEIALLASSFNDLGQELETKKNELLDINTNLEKKVAKEVKKNMQKEQLLMQKSKLASMAGLMDAVAHQWKQPLSVISLTASNLKLQRQIKGEVSKELIDKTADDIDLQITHLVETVDEFRKFFRPDANKENVSFKKLIKSVLEINSNLLISNHIKSVVNIDKNIKYDILQAEFKHVFINFINNAKDAFVENNIEDRQLVFDAFEDKSNIILTVTDNAGGIPEDIIDTVFDANITTKVDGQGTGIGLYMSKQIVEKINGILSVENIEFDENEKKQKGAKFTIKLPKFLK